MCSANKRKQKYISIRSYGTTTQSRRGLVGRGTQNTGYFWRLCVHTVPDREAVEPGKCSTSRPGQVEYMKTIGFLCKYIAVNLVNMLPEI